MLITLGQLKAGIYNINAHITDNKYDDDQLTDLIYDAGGMLQSALGWPIEAYHSTETMKGSGTNVLHTRYYPICSVNHVYIVYPGQSVQQYVDVFSQGAVVIYPELGEIQNYNPFVFQTGGYLTIFPSGTPIQVDYTYGYPVANLSSDISVGATSIPVSNPFGFAHNTDYTIYDGVRTEVVTTYDAVARLPGDPVYVDGTSPLLIRSATKFAHSALGSPTVKPTQAITNMPRDIIRVMRRVVERRLIGMNNPAFAGVSGRTTGDPMKLTESYNQQGAMREALEYEIQYLLSTYNRRTGIV